LERDKIWLTDTQSDIKCAEMIPLDFQFHLMHLGDLHMKTLIGGTIAAALGLIGIGIWWKSLLIVLGGAFPTILVLGGALAVYLGYDELKDSWKRE
jgi:hypothetical protein